MDPGKSRDSEAGPRDAEGDRRRFQRYPCQRLVVIRLPDAEGVWRWYWVTDVSAGGVAVSFAAETDSRPALDTTLLDVDSALSFAVSVRFAWRTAAAHTRTGCAFLRTDPGLAKWAESFARANPALRDPAQGEFPVAVGASEDAAR